MANYRRRQLIVDKRMQSRIITQIAWPAAICVLVSATLMGLFCANLTEQALAIGARLDGVWTMLAVSLTFVVLSSGYFLFHCLTVSHRVAGPVYRMKATLRAIRNGDPSQRVGVRDKDFLAEFSDELNAFLDWAEPQLTASPQEGTEATPSLELDSVPSVVVEPQPDGAGTSGREA